jgi:membrane-associated PAP2 superfamily phosphatase
MLWGTLLLLVGSLVVFELTGLDLWVQDFFYNATTHRWIVDEKEPVGTALFYNGPKVVVGLVALACLTLAVGPVRWRERFPCNRRGLWVVLLTIATVPVLAGVGKKFTDTFCPFDIRRYGGDIAYVKLCEPYPANDKPARRGGCFPAGHASGGFALLSLVALRRTRRWRNAAIALGLGLGWWMGFYQMLKGAHYLSHTTTTMLLAWIVVLLWGRILRLRPWTDKGHKSWT